MPKEIIVNKCQDCPFYNEFRPMELPNYCGFCANDFCSIDVLIWISNSSIIHDKCPYKNNEIITFKISKSNGQQ